jgi:hypothetical protein
VGPALDPAEPHTRCYELQQALVIVNLESDYDTSFIRKWHLDR